MSLDVEVPFIGGLSVEQAEEAFSVAGWKQLHNNPGQNARVLFSSCSRYVARFAQNDPGFEEFAAMCEEHDSSHLPNLHVNYLSDSGVHLTIMDRLKRYRHDVNPEVAKQVKAVQDLIWGRDETVAGQLDSSIKKTLLFMLERAIQAHGRNPEIYEGLDLAGDDPENFLFHEDRDGAVRLVFTDVFARRGCLVAPDWDALHKKLSQDSVIHDAPICSPPAKPL